MNDGVWQQPSDYSDEPTPISRKLSEDGRRHLLMDGPIAFDGSVHLLHGHQDPDVPWRTSLDLAERLTSGHVTIELSKTGDHRLSTEADLGRLLRAVDDITLEVAGRTS